MPSARTLVAVTVLALVPLAGCQAEKAPARPRPVASVPPQPAPAYDAEAEPASAVLSLVPQDADTVTVTDWDAIRVQLGQPDLTSEGLGTDRFAFWERADTESAALTEGMLRADGSTFELDYGFTQDDVDWEAHWRGEDGRGFALALRPDLALDGVRRAIADGIGPLEGAELRAADHLVVAGTSETDVWANEEQWEPLVAEPATATYLQRGCTPLNEALGPDGDAEAQAALLEKHPVTTLDDVSGFALGFGDHTAIAWFELGRSDLFDRLRIGEDWPVPPFARTFTNGAADPSSGRLGYAVDDPPAAAGLTLLRELPFSVCPEVVPYDAPTGL
ncbi:hypothetical protein GCM10009623_18960 [Nocardioides aestuarii]|uniref:Uncharacterized protein n=1 Tax=Nocardioides aestuarii TaxID=252231 RepID=A0ABW4TNJ0_9ACTN